MKPCQSVFERVEKKYLCDRHQYEVLRNALSARMTTDRYGIHTICNIYYDTDSWELVRASIEKPLYKEKLRLRSYGVPKSGDPVFVELKKKYDGIVYKRRSPMTLSDARNLLIRRKQPTPRNQILQEIGWFLNRYEPIPRVFLAYERQALSGNEDGSLRVTFDSDIRFRDTALDLSHGHWGTPLLPEGSILMEIKIPGAMPLWLSRTLSELEIYPTSFSKVGEVYKNHLMHQPSRKGGIICA